MQDDFEAVGSIKVKDGLYMGDEYAAQDIEQLKINKINYVVNCAGQDSYNYWESEGIVYMTINWMDTDQQVLFENKGNVLNQIYEFIEIALAKGESVLVHSLRGQNRCTAAMVGYLMKKYRWSLRKSLEYLRFKRPNLPLRPTFYSQLLSLENKLFNMSLDGRTDTWHEVSDIPGSDELVVTHTFLNTKIVAAESTSDVSTAKSSKQSRISWAEELTSQVEIEVHSEEYDEEDEEEDSEVDSKTSLGAYMPENDAEAAPLSWNIKSNASSSEQVGSMKSILRAEARFVAPETVIRRVVSANVSSRNTNNDIRESARTENAKQNFIKKVRPNSSTSHVRATLTSKARVSSATRKMETALAAPSSSQNGGNVINITINNFISENNNNNNAQNGSKHLPGRKLTVNSKLKKNTSSSSATSLDLLQLFAKSDIMSSINHEVPQQKISLSKRPASSVSGQDREIDAWNRTPVTDSMEPLTITGLSASRITNKQMFNQSAPNFRKVAEVPVKCFGGPQYEVNNQFSATVDNLYQQRPSNYANQGRFLPIKVMSNARFFEHSNAMKDTRSKAFKRPASAVNNSTPTKNPLESPYYHPSNNSLHIKRAKEIRSEIQNTKVKAIPSKQNGAKNVLIRSKLRTPSPKYYQGHNFFTSTC